MLVAAPRAIVRWGCCTSCPSFMFGDVGQCNAGGRTEGDRQVGSCPSFRVFSVRGGGGDVGQCRRRVHTWKSKKFVPGSLIGVKDSDFVGRPEAETP